MKISGLTRCLGVAMTLHLTIAAPIEAPTSVNPANAEGRMNFYMNCTGGYTTWCRDRDAECYGETVASEVSWCANNCFCYYVSPCDIYCREAKAAAEAKSTEGKEVAEDVKPVVT